MKNLKTFIAGTALTFGALSASVASTAQEETPYWYVGGNYGLLALDADDEEDFDDDVDAFSLYGGGAFNRVFGAELAYYDFGESSGEFSRIDISGFALSGLAYFAHYERFNFYGRIGALAWDSDFEAEVEGFGLRGDDDGIELFYGLGLDFGITEVLDLRVEWTRFAVDIGEDNEDVDFDEDFNLDYANIGLKLTL